MAKSPARRRIVRKKRSRAAPSFHPDHQYNVVFTAARIEDLAPLEAMAGVDVGCRHPTFRRDRSGFHMAALVAGHTLPSLLAAEAWRAEVMGDLTVMSRAALKLVGRGDRFRKGRVLPQGIGRLV